MAPARRRQPQRQTAEEVKPNKTREHEVTLTIRAHIKRAILLVCLMLTIYVVGQWWFRLQIQSKQTTPQEPSQLDAYIVQSLPNRGKGAIATRDIKRGELLIREKPLFIIPVSTQEDPTVVLQRALRNLTNDERDAYFELSHHVKPGGRTAEEYYRQRAFSIMQTNSITTSAGQVGIFPRTARLNHACLSSFNCVYTWREEEGVLVTHALKNIGLGEELLFAYFNTRKSRAERQLYLSDQYEFNCTCATCSLPEDLSHASDERVATINALYSRLASWQEKAIDGHEAVEIANQIWKLGEEEGYHSERGQLAADMVHVAAAHSDISGVLAWARIAEEWFGYETGQDSLHVRLIRKVIQDPRTHWNWGTREIMLVGRPAF